MDMRLLTHIVFYSTTILSFIISSRLVAETDSRLKLYGIPIVIAGILLSILNYFLIAIETHSVSFSTILLFFIRHFWFILLYVIFLKHILLQEKNFWYYFSIPVSISVLIMTCIETLIILSDVKIKGNLARNFLYWSSYFGVFGGVASGLVLSCLKKIKGIQWSLKTVITGFFHILFLGICAIFPPVVINVLMPNDSWLLLFIAPTFAYAVSFIVFGEIMDFTSYLKKNTSSQATGLHK